MLSPSRYIDHLRDDAARLIDAAMSAPTADVPTCPAWTNADLLRHVAQLHQWCAVNVGHLAPTRETVEFDDPQAPDALAAWAIEQARFLVDVFARTDPDAVMWTHWGKGPAAYWFRRMAQETSVHRWDGQLAAGHLGPFDPTFAADGVDEFLSVYAEARDEHGVMRVAAPPMLLTATDTGDRWLLTADADHFHAEHLGDPLAAPAVDHEACATAQDLLLGVWGRTDLAEVACRGGDVTEAWLQRLRSAAR